MKLFELTSGFIAAVVVALGVNYYVNNATVEEEPVVTEAVNKVANLHWYQRQVDGSYTYDGLRPEPSSECDGESDDICAKGFTEENRPSNPADVNDNTSSDDERFYD